MLSSLVAISTVHKHCGSTDIMVLLCRVTSKDHVIKVLCELKIPDALDFICDYCLFLKNMA